MSTEIQGALEAHVTVNAIIINKAEGMTLTLAEGANQIKSKNATAAPTEVSSGQTVKFTMSPHDEIKYLTGAGDDAYFKIKFDDDDDYPKLKLGDAYDCQDAKVGVKTITVERKEESETKIEEETTETFSIGPPRPEFKETKETEEETETGNTKSEVKTKSKVEYSKKGKKTSVVKKTETKKKEAEVTWEIYSV